MEGVSNNRLDATLLGFERAAEQVLDATQKTAKMAPTQISQAAQPQGRSFGRKLKGMFRKSARSAPPPQQEVQRENPMQLKQQTETRVTALVDSGREMLEALNDQVAQLKSPHSFGWQKSSRLQQVVEAKQALSKATEVARTAQISLTNYRSPMALATTAKPERLDAFVAEAKRVEQELNQIVIEDAQRSTNSLEDALSAYSEVSLTGLPDHQMKAVIEGRQAAIQDHLSHISRDVDYGIGLVKAETSEEQGSGLVELEAVQRSITESRKAVDEIRGALGQFVPKTDGEATAKIRIHAELNGAVQALKAQEDRIADLGLREIAGKLKHSAGEKEAALKRQEETKTREVAPDASDKVARRGQRLTDLQSALGEFKREREVISAILLDRGFDPDELVKNREAVAAMTPDEQQLFARWEQLGVEVPQTEDRIGRNKRRLQRATQTVSDSKALSEVDFRALNQSRESAEQQNRELGLQEEYWSQVDEERFQRNPEAWLDSNMSQLEEVTNQLQLDADIASLEQTAQELQENIEQLAERQRIQEKLEQAARDLENLEL